MSLTDDLVSIIEIGGVVDFGEVVGAGLQVDRHAVDVGGGAVAAVDN